MRDAWFLYAHLALWGGVLVGYAVRLTVRGAWHSDRVAAIGGSVLVGRGAMEMASWALDPVVRGAVRLRITPDQLTWSSLVLAGGAAAAVLGGWFGLACLLLTWSMLCDVLDGQVARTTGVGSMRGEVLDSAIDRYCEMIYLGALAVSVRAEVWQLVIVVGALVASIMVSYAGVMADAVRVKVPRGLMRRHERGVYLIATAALVPVLGPVLHDRWGVPVITPVLAGCALVAVVGNVAAITKLARVARAA